MRNLLRALLALLACSAAAAGAAFAIVYTMEASHRVPRTVAQSASTDKTQSQADASTEPPLPKGTFIDQTSFEDGGVGLTHFFTGPIEDPTSLEALRAALEARKTLGTAVLRAKMDELHLDEQSPREQQLVAIQVKRDLSLLLVYDGRFKEASEMLEQAVALCDRVHAPARVRLNLTAMRGIFAMRRGEVENCIECVGPSSCIFPITREAAHQVPAGSLEAIRHYTAYLEQMPGDLRVRWLLNLASMTVGDYPDRVPAKYRIPLDSFRSEREVDRFENVATTAGLTARGPNLAGGSVFDDFNGDGWPDLFTTSLDFDRGASLFVNRGDGTFEDRSKAAGLAKQVYALNTTRADIDNDGDLDLLLLRGGWESPLRLSLLKNRGDGTFEDVTIAAGLGEPIASESAAWGDYDNDGLVDLFVSGEYYPPEGESSGKTPDPRNRCRLYHNEGNGTFRNVAKQAGVAEELCSKGSGWGDYDGDGLIDLYISNMIGPCRLFHNDGNGTFHDVASELGATGANSSFAVWFWDFDNDGRLDLYVNDNSFSLSETVATYLSIPTDRQSRPRLYRNLGRDGFRDVAVQAGLDRALTPMGCNFGDIDNDGFPDTYIGTGGMSFEFLVPNVLFKNVDGTHFADVTMSSGTGHLQKGHGVSFADYDNDGDLDLFVELGGAVPGDRAHNALFRNPLHGRHYLKLKLVGTQTNRAALGARVHVTVKDAGGAVRSVYRTIGNNSSFGGNSLVELIGLGDATGVEEVEVYWPTSRTTQKFQQVAGDRTIQITEGSDELKPLPMHSAPVKQR